MDGKRERASTQEADEPPLVSVVTVFHNRERFVLPSIGSLLCQTYQPLEIICIDDGSTDGTLKALQSVKDPKLRVVGQANRGFTNSIRLAVQIAGGEFIAIHGAGDKSFPSRIAKQADVLSSRPNIAIVGCYVENIKLDGEVVIFRPRDDCPLADALKLANPFTHGEVMFRRSLYEKVGGYRSAFVYAQDRDLWWRMSRHADHAIVKEVLYRRRKFENGVSADPLRLMKQYMLSDLANQSAKQVDAGNKDLVDQYGFLAFYMKEPSPALANRLAWLALRSLSLEQKTHAALMLRVGRAEALTRAILIARACYILSHAGVLWRWLILPLLKRRFCKRASLQ